MHLKALSLYERARVTHAEAYQLAQDLKRALGGSGDPEELADAILALKQSAKLLDDARKECGKVCELFERLCCLAWLTRGTGEPIRTPYTTASPTCKQVPAVPARDSAEYARLLEHYGIPEGSPFRPHWPSLLDAVSRDLAAGKTIPPGCDPARMLQVFRVTTRLKQSLLPANEVLRQPDPDLLRSLYEIVRVLDPVLVTARAALASVKAEDLERDTAAAHEPAEASVLSADDDNDNDESSPF
jgi:hypothetical protein